MTKEIVGVKPYAEFVALFRQSKLIECDYRFVLEMKKPLSELNGFTSHTEVTEFEAAPDVKSDSIGQGHLLSLQAMVQVQCIFMTGRVGLICFSAYSPETDAKTKLRREGQEFHRNVRSGKGR